MDNCDCDDLPRGRGAGRRHPGAGMAAHREARVAHMRAALAGPPATPLTDAERADLLLMREEEKIARDVYLRLYARWGIRPFANISGSEQAHMDMMLALLERHGVPDPVAGLPAGVFQTPAMRRLYAELVEKGLKSEGGAIQVGLLIEELDIADLQHATARTDKPEIRAVYAELERGSRNHLRAFYRWKQHLGIDYQAAHLAQAELERTALSAHEACG